MKNTITINRATTVLTDPAGPPVDEDMLVASGHFSGHEVRRQEPVGSQALAGARLLADVRLDHPALQPGATQEEKDPLWGTSSRRAMAQALLAECTPGSGTAAMAQDCSLSGRMTAFLQSEEEALARFYDEHINFHGEANPLRGQVAAHTGLSASDSDVSDRDVSDRDVSERNASERDRPLQFFLYCQQWECVAHVLEEAVDQRHLPMTCLLLYGMQQAQRQGLVKDQCLQNGYGRTLLHEDFFYDELEPEWRRLVLAFDVLNVDEGDIPPLCRAAGTSTPDADPLASLLEAGANPNAKTCRGISPLHFCVQDADTRSQCKLNLLLQAPGIDLNPVCRCANYNRTPLGLAVHRANSFAVDKLLGCKGLALNCLTQMEGFCGSVQWGSELALAVDRFLRESHYPLDILERLARAGARLLVMGSGLERDAVPGALCDLTDDVTGFCRLFSDRMSAATPERIAQLAAAVEQGLAMRDDLTADGNPVAAAQVTADRLVVQMRPQPKLW